MSAEQSKRFAAEAALEFIDDVEIVGVGTGSTVNFFIDALAARGLPVRGAVSSSEASTHRLRDHGIEVLDLNETGELGIYVDGADEANPRLELIKGGGGALTREKIVAAAARRFVCIVDDSKLVDVLGRFPLPIEVIPMARSSVAREVTALGGDPRWRRDFVSDNGNQILDVHGLAISEPAVLETTLNQVPGVVTVGLFARRPADILLVGSSSGVRRIERLCVTNP